MPVPLLPGTRRSLLDGFRHERGIVHECLPPFGLGEQQEGAGADGDDGGFVPGEQQRHRHGGRILVGDALGCAEPGDHVVAGFVVFAGDEVLAVAEQLAEPVFGFGAVASVAGGLGPCAELVTVLIRHAEQLADHQDRQR